MASKTTDRLKQQMTSRKTRSDVHVRNRLIEITKRYNPKFSASELDSIIQEGTFDFYGTAVGKEPTNALEKSDAQLLNDLYDGLRDSEYKKNKTKLMESGGQLDSVSDILPSSNLMSVIEQTDMSVIEPMEHGGEINVGSEILFPYGRSGVETRGIITREVDEDNWEVSHRKGRQLLEKSEVIGIAPPVKKRFGFFGKGGEAQEKFVTVMEEYKEGKLKHGTTGKTVDKRDMALAIAYSEAREIDPSFGKYEGGGDTTKDEAMNEKNKEIELILAKKGLSSEKYSAMDKKTITHYSYPYRISNFLTNKLWGLVNKHGFEGFKGSNISVINVGNGEILRFIPDSVGRVDCVERDSDLFIISNVLFKSANIHIYKSSTSFKQNYDLCVGVCGKLMSIVDPNIYSTIKSSGLMVVVVSHDLFEGNSHEAENARQILNSQFDLLEAYRLPSDVMDGYDLVALKRK